MVSRPIRGGAPSVNPKEEPVARQHLITAVRHDDGQNTDVIEFVDDNGNELGSLLVYRRMSDGKVVVEAWSKDDTNLWMQTL
jgi:hypothetical protein